MQCNILHNTWTPNAYSINYMTHGFSYTELLSYAKVIKPNSYCFRLID